MRKANPRKTFLTGFSLLRFQLILLLVTVCVRVIFWIFHAPASLAVMLIVTFFTGNLALGVFLPTRRWFTHRPPPWNWIIYLPLLVGTGILASVVAEIPLFLLTSRNISFGRAFLLDAPLGITITVIVGVVYYAFGDTRLRLEARNQQLQSQVQLGLMERQTHQTDLQQAHEIQMHLLPRETPQLPGFQIACAWQPARSVSGDYFDVLVLAKNKLGLCIADVSGKGMAAALLMANLQASVKAFTADSDHSLTVSPAELCAKLNNALCDHIAPGRFITFFYGILDGATRKLRYENAGHCLPVLVHANGAIEFPAAYSGVLGLFSHWTYSDREVQLVSGDVLLLMTDGVFEAWDAKEEEYGYQRLIASVMASRHQGVHAIRKRVLEDVTAFCSNQFQDDASLIVITVD
ncbi:MAG TPA: PP2C family protein-serine/threonine phosphatase [Silvibacterium sp.]|nr:PP2C family protein-serine/threonine phosphatase [Silvibacterium sp.]